MTSTTITNEKKKTQIVKWQVWADTVGSNVSFVWICVRPNFPCNICFMLQISLAKFVFFWKFPLQNICALMENLCFLAKFVFCCKFPLQSLCSLVNQLEIFWKFPLQNMFALVENLCSVVNFPCKICILFTIFFAKFVSSCKFPLQNLCSLSNFPCKMCFLFQGHT